MIELSQDQELAIQKITAHLTTNTEAVLAGAAGTGKTTTLLRLLDRLPYHIMFFTPTGKAALRVKEQTGRECTTIHSGFFTSVDESENESGGEKLTFSQPSPPEGSGSRTLWVIDESSMIGTEIANVIREQRKLVNCRILWVGDDEQLPPVEGKWGVNFRNATGRLTTVHRQEGDSNILSLATCVRQGKGDEYRTWENDTLLVNAEVHDAVKWYVTVEEQGRNVGLITFTNKTRKLANFLYRRERSLPQGRIQKGETLLITMNKKDMGLVNGQQVRVSKVEEYEEMSRALQTRVEKVTLMREHMVGGKISYTEQTIFCMPELFDADTKQTSESKLHRERISRLYDKQLRDEVTKATGWDSYEIRLRAKLFRDRLVQATWGYCLTVHKSQGSQWDEVGFISCGFFRKTLTSDPDFGKRLYYTAITRAAKMYVEFKCSFIPNVNSLRDKPTETQSSGGTMTEVFRNIALNGGKMTVTSKRTNKTMKYIFCKAKDKDFTFVHFDKQFSATYMGIYTPNGFRHTKASKYGLDSVEIKGLEWAVSNLSEPSHTNEALITLEES